MDKSFIKSFNYNSWLCVLSITNICSLQICLCYHQSNSILLQGKCLSNFHKLLVFYRVLLLIFLVLIHFHPYCGRNSLELDNWRSKKTRFRRGKQGYLFTIQGIHRQLYANSRWVCLCFHNHSLTLNIPLFW